MGAIASQITSLTIVFSTVYLDTDQRKHQSSPSLDFVRGIHRRPVNSPHKWPVTRKIFPFDDFIMSNTAPPPPPPPPPPPAPPHTHTHTHKKKSVRLNFQVKWTYHSSKKCVSGFRLSWAAMFADINLPHYGLRTMSTILHKCLPLYTFLQRARLIINHHSFS